MGIKGPGVDETGELNTMLMVSGGVTIADRTNEQDQNMKVEEE